MCRVIHCRGVCAAMILIASVVAPAVASAEEPDFAAEVKRIFRTRCFECHGDTRREADINILEHESYVGADGTVVPGDLGASVLFDYVASDDEDFRMPEAPRPPLSAGEIELIKKWIESGAPAFPEDVDQPADDHHDAALTHVIGAEYVLSRILQHVEATPRDDRRFLRFFSSNHLLTAGATAAELTEHRHALAKAVNHLSWQPDIVQPTIVDEGTGTLFAVDIRELGWHETPFTSAGNDTSELADHFNLYDQVLLEYPYGMAFESSATYQRLFDVYLKPAQLVRPVPCVRIDWFVSVATQSPLYEDMLQLPHDLAELEADLGVDSASNLESFVARRAGMTLSGVSRNNRVVERHPARYGAYWKSYDFQSSRGLQNMFADPIDFHYAGGEMIWNLPNGLQGYLVTDTAGNRILEAPTSIVTDKFAEDKVVRNGLACMRCHDRGMKRFADNIRPAFASLPDRSGVRRAEVLKLYPPKKKMDELLDRDQERFLAALEKALGDPPQGEPLIPTSRKFLDAPLTLRQAAAELGLKDSAGLQTVFQLPQFTQLGLAGLASGGVIRRDTWEDYFDRVVRQLGIGVPIAAVDGLTRPDHLSDGLAVGLKISTNKRSNIFSPNEEMFITVKNDSGVDLFIELVGSSARGDMVVLTADVLSLKNGQTFRFPETGSITIQPRLGTEFITVFASPDRFSPGTLLRGEDSPDRFVHGFYHYNPDETRVDDNPVKLIKKTLKIETR
ncbi:MAG: c-type cytochrome domain-containing protein [Fuerstiella sp.]